MSASMREQYVEALIHRLREGDLDIRPVIEAQLDILERAGIESRRDGAEPRTDVDGVSGHPAREVDKPALEPAALTPPTPEPGSAPVYDRAKRWTPEMRAAAAERARKQHAKAKAPAPEPEPVAPKLDPTPIAQTHAERRATAPDIDFEPEGVARDRARVQTTEEAPPVIAPLPDAPVCTCPERHERPPFFNAVLHSCGHHPACPLFKPTAHRFPIPAGASHYSGYETACIMCGDKKTVAPQSFDDEAALAKKRSQAPNICSKCGGHYRSELHRLCKANRLESTA